MEGLSKGSWVGLAYQVLAAHLKPDRCAAIVAGLQLEQGLFDNLLTELRPQSKQKQKVLNGSLGRGGFFDG